jgi:3-(3-hydroxy-phenyl)propionate hydroxylase
LDISDFPTRHPYGLGLWQNHIERILAEWVGELEVPIHREREVTGFAQDDAGVDVQLSDGGSVRAEYLVGCDGGRSLVRKAAGIEFPGWDPTTSSLIAQVEMTEEPELGIRRTPSGTHALGKVEYEIEDGEVVYKPGGTVGVMLTESHIGTSEPTLRDLSDGLIAVYGTDYGIHSPTFISRFTDMTRQAAAYRKGRILLAGDAAHVHYPVGGQGLNIGVQDAVNLGWKLAQVVNQTSPESLLDTYHVERHPVGCPRAAHHDGAGRARPPGRPHRGRARRRRRASRHGRASQTIRRGDVRSGHPLRPRRWAPTARTPHARSRPGHRRRPPARLHPAARCPPDAPQPRRARRSSRSRRGPIGFRVIAAKYVGTWELPALGEVTAPTAVLIRPDGYVAWVGEQTQRGLDDALTTWFGPAATSTAR